MAGCWEVLGVIEPLRVWWGTFSVAEFFTLYKDSLISVTWLLAGIGWFVNNRMSNERETRKEIRSEVEALCKAAAEVLKNVQEYYSKSSADDGDSMRSAKVAFDLKRILRRTERLQYRVSQFSSVMAASEAMFEAITQEPFASSTRPVEGVDSIILRDIEQSVHEYIDALEDAFVSAYG